MTVHTPTRRTRADSGRVAAFTVVLTAAVLAVAGLVLDAGLALAGQTRAYNIATDAARTGAQQLDLALYRGSGQTRLDPTAAQAAATTRLEQVGADGTASATPTTVTVTVTTTQPTQLLAIFGVPSITTSATATATPLHGITTPAAPAGPP